MARCAPAPPRPPFRVTQMATAKQLINGPETIVDEMLEGVLLSNPNLSQLDGVHVCAPREFSNF